jgi:hypothetical protein
MVNVTLSSCAEEGGKGKGTYEYEDTVLALLRTRKRTHPHLLDGFTPAVSG